MHGKQIVKGIEFKHLLLTTSMPLLCVCTFALLISVSLARELNLHSVLNSFMNLRMMN